MTKRHLPPPEDGDEPPPPPLDADELARLLASLVLEGGRTEDAE